MTEEEAEILRNTRAARDRGEITQEDLNETVYLMVARARAERELTCVKKENA